MTIISISILLVLLFNVLYVLREKSRRRVAAAKLEIVETVTDIEKMMLERKICLGDICHDKFHERMIAAQYASRFGVSWKLFTRGSTEWEAMKERIETEIENDTELGKLVRRHMLATYKAFINQRPFVSLFFWLWVVARAGGILILIAGLFAILKALIFTEKALIAFREKRAEFKNNAAEWYSITRVVGFN